MLDIKIRKLRESAKLPKHVGGNTKSCWMDLYASKIEVIPEYGQPRVITEHGDTINYNAGDVVKVKFGVAMELPEGYEGYIVPRSSTFKNYGLLLTNSHGVIDEAYAGDTDEWMGMFLATRDGSINIGDRPAQFRVQQKMPEVNFIEVDKLENSNRGGYGTSGK
ncbi:hypothetical protein G166_gp53 [Clostridium phage phi8074-B1]|uniref:hypothetical protein n=1 Tax=Clostridium phage phi8074-B1 TaxID=1147137 RepID=UPI00025C0C68|nr:hypothetical protein G166_gp53 [Clostridium phage phi8074-B1]AFC61985.1 hypothetical protein phi8074-B1_00053 [Clostridium phage phi8074-B1]